MNILKKNWNMLDKLNREARRKYGDWIYRLGYDIEGNFIFKKRSAYLYRGNCNEELHDTMTQELASLGIGYKIIAVHLEG